MLLGGLALVAYGVYLMMTSSFGMVAIVFGVIGLLFGMSDMRDFLHHPADKMAWWYSHMTRMLAAYIATVTAFSVVNFQFSTARRALALGDRRRDRGYRYLDEILLKEV